MLNHRHILRKSLLMGAGIGLLIGSSSFAGETTDLSKHQPHPPTTRPPEVTVRAAKPSAPPTFDFKTTETPRIIAENSALKPGDSSAGNLSGYIVFLASALLLFRKKN